MSEQIQQAIQTLTGAITKNPAAAKAVFRAATVSASDSFATESTIRVTDRPSPSGGADRPA